MSRVIWAPKPANMPALRASIPTAPVMMRVGGNAALADNAPSAALPGPPGITKPPALPGDGPASMTGATQDQTQGGPPAEPGSLDHDAAPSASDTRTYRFVMAGGGTGGHLYPGLAVAEALQQQLGARVELLWAATPRPVDQRLLTPFGSRYIAQPVLPLQRKLSALWPFWRAWRRSCAYWDERFSRDAVDGVLALGGYAAGPAAHVASRRGIPVALLNPDAVPGLANRFLLRRAAVVFTQWELPGHLAGRVHGRVLTLGCPIRAELFGRTRAEGAARLGLDPARPTLLITGGSLAARTINEAIVELLADGAVQKALAAWQVLHLAGADFAARVKAAAEPIQDVSYHVVDYCDDMASAYAASDLAVARAGASTCAELAACGVPSVLLPYPYHRDLHQRHNAQKLVDAGCAVLLDDRKDALANAAALKVVLLDLLPDAARRAALAARARQHGKPDAAAAIARELVALTNR